jgi:hypothetical protein
LRIQQEPQVVRLTGIDATALAARNVTVKAR